MRSSTGSVKVTPQGVEDVKIGQAPLDPSEALSIHYSQLQCGWWGWISLKFLNITVMWIQDLSMWMYEEEFLEKHSPIDVNAFNDQGEMVYTTARSD